MLVDFKKKKNGTALAQAPYKMQILRNGGGVA